MQPLQTPNGNALVQPPLSLYVHLPWCKVKCPYCDFNSHPLRGDLQEAAYCDALLGDLDQALPALEGREFGTVFFGGGTPSLFSAASIERVLARVRPQLAADAEITLEANPGAVEHGRFAELRAVGVNRLSIGVQSFDAAKLAVLGRIHGPEEAVAAMTEALAAGFTAINLDLMYGLPGQDTASALDDLAKAIALAPAHLSHYQLTIEPGTMYAARPPQLPDEDECWRMQLQCQEMLEQAGYEQYEVSAYARPGQRCRHNLNYWRFGDYLGIGAGAHGKLSDAAAGIVRREQRVRSPRLYMESTAAGTLQTGRRDVEPREAAFEFFLNVLRLREPFSAESLLQRSGCPAHELGGPLTAALDRGLLQACGEQAWETTELGRRFLDDLQALFLPASAVPATAPQSTVKVQDNM